MGFSPVGSGPLLSFAGYVAVAILRPPVESRHGMFRDPRHSLLLILVPLLTIAGVSCPLRAQDPIRVESNQVLVPVVVLNDKLYTRLKKAQLDAHQRSAQLLDNLAIRDLSVKDFHLFEDGQQQTVQSVAPEAPGFSMVRDNFGKHPETTGSGGGRWGYPDVPTNDLSEWLAWPKYVIAYVPPPSPTGSCHQIHVKVGRPHALVWARSEYCNTKHPPTDPLNGTAFGNQMEAALASPKESKIPLAVQAVSFLEDPGQGRVYIELEFPWQSLKYEFKQGTLYASFGALLMIYNRDGTLAARISDFACCDYGNDIKKPAKNDGPEVRSGEAKSVIPDRLETQIEIPPGIYELRAIFSDGENFGRKRVPLTIEPYGAKQLALSQIALARRVRKLDTQPPDPATKQPGTFSPLISKGVEFTPTTDAHFQKDQLLCAYFEVNDPQRPPGAATTVKAHLRIVDANTGKVKLDFEPVSAATYVTPGSSLIPIARGIDLSTLADGPYRLEVQATAAGQYTPWRAANFEVDPGNTPEIILPPASYPAEVTLNIKALDDTGNPVTDLTVADFQVFDGDKPQTITGFALMVPQPGADTPPTSMTYKLFYVSETRAANFDGLRIVCTRKNVRVELQQAYFDAPQ
jgi:hypothetical protein